MLYLQKHLKHLLLPLVVAAVVFTTAGCPKDPYMAAIKGSDDVAEGVHQSVATIGKLYSEGAPGVDDAYKVSAGHYLDVITDCNMGFRKSVVTAHNSGLVAKQAFLPIADSFVTCTQKALPPGGATQSALKAVDSAIKGISLAISNAKGGK